MGEKARKLVCQPDVAALVPEALARRYEFFPLRYSRKRTAFLRSSAARRSKRSARSTSGRPNRALEWVESVITAIGI